MSVLHLLWIVPLSAFIGYVSCALLTISSRADDHAEIMRDFKEEK